MRVEGGAVLLWALRSPCEAMCNYCYFGSIEEHREHPVQMVGQLSHLSTNDLSAAQILTFAATIPGSPVGRAVIAGGEPLNWVPVFQLIKILRDGGVSVTVATNGVPLNKPHIVAALIDLGVDAVSVSLDSVDPVYNDRMRPFRNPAKGWAHVVSGIRALVTARGAATRPQIGIYSVITKDNLADLAAIPPFATDLGVDYFVPQPLSLAPDNALFPLCLTAEDVQALHRALAQARTFGVRMPSDPYPDQFAAVISAATGEEAACFGGRDLFFVQPNGTVWDCPSSLKIAATPPDRYRSIVGATAAAVFAPAAGCGDCALMSDDCVAMFPLVRDIALYRAGRS